MRFVRGHVMTLQSVQNFIARRSSQLSVNYRASSLSRSYHRPPTEMLPPRRGREAGVADGIRFRAGPRAGDRAPDGLAISATSREETSLFRELRGTRFGLLLFGGPARKEADYERLVKVARRAEERLPHEVRAHLIVAADEVPERLGWSGSVLLDGSGMLHKLYGARAEALYLVRPDGYIGLRGQPAREDQLLDYLGHLFPWGIRLSAAGGRLRDTPRDPSATLPTRRTNSVK
jgi:hypothetical protein